MKLRIIRHAQKNRFTINTKKNERPDMREPVFKLAEHYTDHQNQLTINDYLRI